jgi:hypothetical protein
VDSDSKGTAYDRFGAKSEKTTFAADPKEFEGLKNGEWTVFRGWTNKTNEAIQSAGMLFRYDDVDDRNLG